VHIELVIVLLYPLAYLLLCLLKGSKFIEAVKIILCLNVIKKEEVKDGSRDF
jgi:hypothetical protein